MAVLRSRTRGSAQRRARSVTRLAPLPESGALRWSNTIETAIRAIFGIAVLYSVLISLRPATAVYRLADPAGKFMVLSVTLACLIAVPIVLLRYRDQLVTFCFAALISFTTALMPFAVDGEFPSALLRWNGVAKVLALFLLVALLPARRALPLAGLLIATGSVTRVAIDGGAPSAWLSAVNAFIQLATVTVLIGLCVRLLRSIAAHMDRAAADAALLRQRATELEANQRARADIDRLVHDRVLSALHCVKLGGKHLSWQLVRDEARRALSILGPEQPTDHVDAVSLSAALRAAAARSRINVELTQPDTEILVPPCVAEALVGATAEALRNTARHAGVGDARIAVTTSAQQITVEITDAGEGFDVRQLPATSLGINRSIRSRMDAVGGVTVITSAPGEGTTVRLSWGRTVTSQSLPAPAITTKDGKLINHLAYAGVGPLLLMTTGHSLLNSHQLLRPWVGYTAAVAIVLTAVALMLVRRRRRISALASAAAGVICIVLPAVAAAQLPSSYSPLFVPWMTTAGVPIIMLLMIYRPLWESVAIAVLSVAAVSTVMINGLAPTESFAAYLEPLLAPVILLLAALTIKVSIRLVTHISQRHAHDRRLVKLQEAAVTARSKVFQQRIAELSSDAIPLLNEVVAAPDEPPAGIDLRASVIGAGIRDRIYAARPLHPGTKASVAACRTAGWSIDLRPCTGDDVAWAQVLLAALSPFGPLRMTMSSLPHGDQLEVTVTIHHEPTNALLAALQPTYSAQDGDLLVDAESIRLQLFIHPDDAPRPQVPRRTAAPVLERVSVSPQPA